MLNVRCFLNSYWMGNTETDRVERERKFWVGILEDTQKRHKAEMDDTRKWHMAQLKQNAATMEQNVAEMERNIAEIKRGQEQIEEWKELWKEERAMRLAAKCPCCAIGLHTWEWSGNWEAQEVEQ